MLGCSRDQEEKGVLFLRVAELLLFQNCLQISFL